MRWFGPSRAELRAEAAMWRRRRDVAQAQRDDAHVQIRQFRTARGVLRTELSEARRRVEHLETELRKVRIQLQLAAEPEQTGCTKVRLHFKAEAEAWRDRIAQTTRSSVDDLRVYVCKTCPRSPVTSGHYWHVGHADPEVKAASLRQWRADRRKAAAEGRTVGQLVDPAVMARLRTMGAER
jgi:hypothetical protein